MAIEAQHLSRVSVKRITDDIPFGPDANCLIIEAQRIRYDEAFHRTLSLRPRWWPLCPQVRPLHLVFNRQKLLIHSISTSDREDLVHTAGEAAL